MPEPVLATVLADDRVRSTHLTLARLHLRVGSLALAQADLETEASRGGLDDDGWMDLAEARWRANDIGRAGEAATAMLDRGSESPLMLMIAAEAAAALGRPGEARRLAGRAMAGAGGTLDALFAGMSRSAVWPADPADPSPVPSTLFGADVVDLPPASPDVIAETGPIGAAAAAAATAIAGSASDANAPGLWDDDDAPPASPNPMDPAGLLEAGLIAYRAGDEGRAATLLGLAMRSGPHVAPAILDGTIDSTHPGVLLVRGDAYRSVGQTTEAADAYAAAALDLQGSSPDADRDAEDAALQSGPTGPTPQ